MTFEFGFCSILYMVGFSSGFCTFFLLSGSGSVPLLVKPGFWYGLFLLVLGSFPSLSLPVVSFVTWVALVTYSISPYLRHLSLRVASFLVTEIPSNAHSNSLCFLVNQLNYCEFSIGSRMMEFVSSHLHLGHLIRKN